MSDDDTQWWFCLKHNEVEQGTGCANSDRLGPFATREEATAAIAHAAERSEQWDNDPRWNDD